jgi:hypothetical protein
MHGFYPLLEFFTSYHSWTIAMVSMIEAAR